MSTVTRNGMTFQQLYTSEYIQKVVADLAEKINHHYDQIIKDKEGDALDLVIVCVLKGAFMFYSDLVKHIRIPHNSEFIKCRSYQSTTSTGHVQFSEELEPKAYFGKHVLIIEDIHDTGHTLKAIIRKIADLKPKSIETAVLVVRPDKPVQIDLKFRALECSDFIIGYGLDLDQWGRNLTAIYQKIN